jgi:hypothetical protein
VAALLTSYPAMFWLVNEPSFFRLLLVELWLFDPYHQQQGDAGCLDVRGRFGGIGRCTSSGRTTCRAKWSRLRPNGVKYE